MNPIDYSIDVQTPFQAALQGYQAGAGIRDDQFKQQQQQTALQQQQDRQKLLYGLATNPNATGADYARVMTVLPDLAEHLNKASSTLSASQLQSERNFRGQVFTALNGGEPTVAASLLQKRADAKRNSGDDQGAQQDEMMVKLIGLHPETAKLSAGAWLAGTGEEGVKIIDAANALQRQPIDLRRAEAEATIKGVEAGNAPTATGLANANAAEDIETKQANREIARLNAQISQANSETQRGELILKRDELVQKQAEKTQANSTTAQDAVDTLNQTRATVDNLMKHPGLSGRFGAGTLGGKQAAMLPGTDAKDFRAQIETLQAQNFQSQIKSMVGMGALSDAEGKKLSAAIANLDPDQSERQLRSNLGAVRSYLDKAISKQVAGGKLPVAGGAFVMKHPVYGNVTEGDINRLLAKFPGSTREQAMQYLRSSGSATGSW